MQSSSNTFRTLQKRIEHYEGNRARELKKSLTYASLPLLIFFCLGIYIVYHGGYIFGGSFIGVIILMLYVYVREIIEFWERKNIHKLLFSDFYENNDINIVLKKSLYIGPIIEKSIQQRMFFQKTKQRTNYFDNVIQYLLIVLTDLRSDLQARIIQQKEILEGAKSELQKNIHGTTELSQVSDLQKARLDRQIEAFEELQKILIKV